MQSLTTPVTSAEEPWHSRLSIASRYMNLVSELHQQDANHGSNTNFFNNDNYDDDDDDMMALFGAPIFDNRSHQCFTSCSSLCLPCPDDKPLWWLVLQWMKMMLLKIARSYHAKPFLLVIAPLLVGLLVGYWLGWQQRQWTQNHLTQPQMHAQKRPTLHGFVQRVRDLLSVLAVRLCTLLPLDDDDQHPAVPSTSVSTPCNTSGLANTAIKSTTTTIETTIGNVTRMDDKNENKLAMREEKVRTNLKSQHGTARESGVPVSQIPRHIAVIMDGNRRYGKAKYGSAARGHWDGSSKLVEFATWCLTEEVKVLTVFAFSSENWNREPTEIAALMQIFAKYCDELRVEALQRNIKIVALSTDFEKIPSHVQEGVHRMVTETEHCSGMIMNICLSYGSRGEIVAAARSIAEDVLCGKIKDPKTSIDEASFQERLLTQHCGGDPDVLIRTSGEVRISNFLLWQLAYTEMFFVEKPWPAIDKKDLLNVIRTYAQGRSRRYGK